MSSLSFPVTLVKKATSGLLLATLFLYTVIGYLPYPEQVAHAASVAINCGSGDANIVQGTDFDSGDDVTLGGSGTCTFTLQTNNATFGTLDILENATLLIDSVTIDAGTMTIRNGAAVSHQSESIIGVDLTITSAFTIETTGIINTDFRGCGDNEGQTTSACEEGGSGAGQDASGGAAGGGHGGKGGKGSNTSGSKGQLFGSSTNPTQLGAGGGTSWGDANGIGGRGGGLVRINADNATVTINGTISANGDPGSDETGNRAGGGGSGGSIYIAAASLSGAGTISANGGTAYDQFYQGGAGGGGRIAVYFSGADRTGATALLAKTTADGGDHAISATTYDGEHGTIIFVNDLNQDSTPIPNGYTSGAIDDDWIRITSGFEFNRSDTGSLTLNPASLQISNVEYLRTAATVSDLTIITESTEDGSFTTEKFTDNFLRCNSSTTSVSITSANTEELKSNKISCSNASVTIDGNTYSSSPWALGIYTVSTLDLDFNGAASISGTINAIDSANNAINIVSDTASDDITFTSATFTAPATGGDSTNTFNVGTTGRMYITGDSTIRGNITSTNITDFDIDTGSTWYGSVVLTSLTGTISIAGALSADSAGCGFSSGPDENGLCTNKGTSEDTGGYGGEGEDGGGGAGGAGHGGKGGTVSSLVGGGTYGDSTAPTLHGSGGGNTYGGDDIQEQGGLGGGIVRLTTSGTLSILGSILANGAEGSNIVSNRASGGGSGGSIYLTAGSIEGSGTIAARGGDAYTNYDSAGTGGGGRIAFYYIDTISGAAYLNATAGAGEHESNSSYQGQAGTVYTAQILPGVPTTLYSASTDASTGSSSPADLTSLTPVFSALCVIGTGQCITAEIEVDDNSDFGSTVWSSGVIDITDISSNTRSENITYAGSQLTYNTTYYWRIRFYNTGGAGSWSDGSDTFMAPRAAELLTFDEGGSVQESTQYPIQWMSYNGETNEIVKIEYSADNFASAGTTIATASSASSATSIHSYSWTVPSASALCGATSCDLRLRISSNNDGNNYAITSADTFSVVTASVSGHTHSRTFSNSAFYTSSSGITYSSGSAVFQQQAWLYKKPLTITEQSASALTDHQVQINLTSSNFDFAKAKSDGSDIRIYENSETSLVSYWIESFNPTEEKAIIWTKIPSLGASADTTVYMYYGNSSATDAGTVATTFVFGDDFSGSKLKTGWTEVTLQGASTGTFTDGKWTKTCDGECDWWSHTSLDAGAYIEDPGGTWEAITRMTQKSGPSNTQMGMLLYQGATDGYMFGAGAAGSANVAITGAGGQCSISSTDIVPYHMKIINTTGNGTGTNDTYNFYGSTDGISWTQCGSYAPSDIMNNVGLFVKDWTSGTTSATYDHFLVKKYVSSEPTVAFGSEVSNSFDANQTIEWNVGHAFASMSDVSHTVSTTSTGAVKYQVSDDDGSSWKYCSGGTLAAATDGYTTANTLSELTNSCLSGLTAGTFKVKTYLHIDTGDAGSVTISDFSFNLINNTAPTVSAGTASQATDGSGEVTATFQIDDADDDDTLQAQVEYSLDGTTWTAATLSETSGKVSATYGSPTIDNNGTYQVGTTSAFITSSSGANTISITWNSQADAGTASTSTAYLRFTGYDSSVAGTADSVAAFTVDNVAPSFAVSAVDPSTTSSSMLISGTAEATASIFAGGVQVATASGAGTYSYTQSLSIGANSLTLYAADAYGNASTSIATTVTRNNPVTGLALTPTSGTLTVGNRVTFTATATYHNASTAALEGDSVTWVIDNTTAGSISTTGVLEGLAVGTITIYATYVEPTNGETVTSNSVSITIAVEQEGGGGGFSAPPSSGGGGSSNEGDSGSSSENDDEGGGGSEGDQEPSSGGGSGEGGTPVTPAPSATPKPKPTPVPTPVPTKKPVAPKPKPVVKAPVKTVTTVTPVPTATPIPSATPTPSASPTSTPKSAAVPFVITQAIITPAPQTPTPSPSATPTPSETPTPTATPTPSPSATPTPEPEFDVIVATPAPVVAVINKSQESSLLAQFSSNTNVDPGDAESLFSARQITQRKTVLKGGLRTASTLQASDLVTNDTDKDGVPDTIEEMMGTDPEDKADMPVDTNDNKIPDYWEQTYDVVVKDRAEDITGGGMSVAIKAKYGLNPTVDDTDGDGISDVDEIYVFNTNPHQKTVPEEALAERPVHMNVPERKLAKGQHAFTGTTVSGSIVRLFLEDRNGARTLISETIADDTNKFVVKTDALIPGKHKLIVQSLIDKNIAENLTKTRNEIESKRAEEIESRGQSGIYVNVAPETITLKTESPVRFRDFIRSTSLTRDGKIVSLPIDEKSGSSLETTFVINKKKLKKGLYTLRVRKGLIAADGSIVTKEDIVIPFSITAPVASISRSLLSSSSITADIPTDIEIFEYDPIEIEVDAYESVKPTPEKLATTTITDDHILKGVRITVENNRPIIEGTLTNIAPNQEVKVIANWQSLLLTSAIIADNNKGDFKIYPPEKLVNGEHNVSLHAVKNDMRSTDVRLAFSVEARRTMHIVYIGLGLLILALFGFLFLRKKKEQ